MVGNPLIVEAKMLDRAIKVRDFKVQSRENVRFRVNTLVKGINHLITPAVVKVLPFLFWGCPRGVMVKAMNCGIVVREFVLQSRYYVHFRANTLGKGMNPLILPPAMDK